MLGSVVGGVGSYLIDLTTDDEKAAAAAKAAMWLSIASASAATGIDVGSSVTGLVMAAKEVGAATIEDSTAKAVFSIAGDTLEAGLSGNVTRLASTSGGAILGGCGGYAAWGKEGITTGMQIGQGLGSPSLTSLGFKGAGTAVGLGVAEATEPGDEDPAARRRFYASIGAGAAGDLGMMSSPMVDEDSVARSLLSEDSEPPKPHTPEAYQAKVLTKQTKTAFDLLGRGAGVGVGAAINARRGPAARGNTCTAMQMGQRAVSFASTTVNDVVDANRMSLLVAPATVKGDVDKKAEGGTLTISAEQFEMAGRATADVFAAAQILVELHKDIRGGAQIRRLEAVLRSGESSSSGAEVRRARLRRLSRATAQLPDGLGHIANVLRIRV
ncbi:MAG: hypothetical protein IPK13_15985 [Deltaproteobacteria bacterium]|nr:hypothetical protein [Deltaproteobacteria bacterium]